MSEDGQNATPPEHAEGSGVTRRDFAVFGGLAAISALLPNVKWLDAQSMLRPGMQAQLVSRNVEQLAGGATRLTMVVELDSPAGLAQVQGYATKAYRTRQTFVQTTHPTANGEIVEYEVAFDPAVPTAIGTKARAMQMRAEVIHGPELEGGMREDTMHVTVSGDAVNAGTTTHRFRRPVGTPAFAAGLDSAQRLQRAVEMINQNGGLMPENIPGVTMLADAGH